jgi:PAS domain S-box-containing protein
MNVQSEPALSVANACFTGGGQMGELMRSIEWSKTPIGAVEFWSPALRMTVGLLLANRFPLLLWWGPCYCQLYNDPYRPVLGDKHPASMGQPASECFPEIWDVIGPLIDTSFSGGSAAWMDDLQLEYIRNDRLEEAHFTVAYSPVPDETVPSGIGGVLATVHEITEQVVGKRRLSALRDLGSRSAEAKTAEEACAIVAATLAQYPEEVPFALLYLLDGDGQKARLAGAAGVEMGKADSPLEIKLRDQISREQPWPLAETLRSETMQIVEDLQEKLSSVPPGPWSAPPRAAIVLPIRSIIAHQLAGFLVLGLSSRLQFNDRYRGFCELVTSQVATAIANARAYDQERKRAEALAAIDRAKAAFFRNVSHEFRRPLTLLLGPLEDELRENPSARERLQAAYRNGLRLLKRVNTLLEVEGMVRLHEFSTRLLATTELQPMLEEVLNATIALQCADFGNVQLYNSRTQTLEIVAQRGFGQDFLAHFSSVNESGAACGRALKRAERVIIEDVLTDPDFAPHRGIAASAGYRAVQSTPLFSRNGEPLGIVSTHFRQPHRPSERELRLTDLYARHAAELIEREQAKEALHESEEKYRTLFDSIDEGFCTIEVLFDGNDKPVDYRFLEVNPSFEKQTGIQNARGRRMREIAPLHEEHWFEIYGKIALTGEPIRFENLAAQLHRWYDVYAFRVGEPQERKVAILFNDITERKRLERRVLEVGDIERRRIGQDLHDDLCQRLAGIQLMGDVLQRDLLAKAKSEAGQAGMIAARIRDAIANTRHIARGLSPVALESNGLMVALQELAENSGKLFQISCEFRFDGCFAVDDNTVATHLYRIAQEAVTNAVKHGHAKEIVIRFTEWEDKRTLTITDDGLGLPETFAKNQGTGLQIMKYRAATIGASLEVRRAGGRGICVSCSFSKQPRLKDW